MKPEMQYVDTVYREGSFSKAAEKLFLTQPALSIAISKIEHSIGMPLFDRSKRPLQLTEAGRIYLDTIEKIRQLEEEQEKKLNDIRELAAGTIQLGGSHYLTAYILPELLAGFSKEYPGITLEITEAGSEMLSGLLADGKLDLTFSCNPQFAKQFEKYRLFQDHILLAVPTSHPFNSTYAPWALTGADIAAGRHLSEDSPVPDPAALAELEYILLKPGNNLHDRAWELFRHAGITPKIRMELSQLVTAYRLSSAGLAATLISDRLVRPDDASLRFYKLPDSFTTRTFYALLPNREYTSAAVKRLIAYLQENLPGNTEKVAP